MRLTALPLTTESAPWIALHGASIVVAWGLWRLKHWAYWSLLAAVVVGIGQNLWRLLVTPETFGVVYPTLRLAMLGIDHLLKQLQDNRTRVRAPYAAKQLQQLQSPASHVIAAVDEALEREQDAEVRATLETARDALAKSAAALRLNGRSPDQLLFPPLCVCCGTPGATEEGKIIMGNSRRKVRFIWQRPDRIELTVLACEPCKVRLDRNTSGAGMAAATAGLLVTGTLLWWGWPYLSWLAFLLLLPWVLTYAGQVGGRLFKRVRHHPQGTTWHDLCHYDGETIRFTLPIFQEQFRALNRG